MVVRNWLTTAVAEAEPVLEPPVFGAEQKHCFDPLATQS